jgi:uncharacterized protein YcfL
MKHSLICLLLIVVLAACSYEKKEELVTTAAIEMDASALEATIPDAADSLEVSIQQKAQEIDDLLKGI